MRNVVAFIPVRGGSKGIPKKNIKLFCGQPLLYWAVKAACDCRDIKEVYVSTDSEAITAVALEFGFTKMHVIKRGNDTATDTATTESAMIEFANKYEFDDIVLIQATSPLIEAKDLICGLRKYYMGYDGVLSVVRQKRFIWKEDENQVVPVNYNPLTRPRRQEMKGFFIENGAFYITSRDHLLKTKSRISGRIGAFEMKEDTYFEIDEPSDWKIMEAMKKRRLSAYDINKLNNINLFITDVDGVMTDAGMYYSDSDVELKKFNTRDGKGLSMVQESGIKVMILTSESTDIVKKRAKKLNVDFCFTGIENKKKKLDEFFKENRQFSYDNTCYIGDDVNDIEVLRRVGFSAAPKDAVESNKSLVDYICKFKGGEGCVREICDLILDSISSDKVDKKYVLIKK